MIRTIVLFLITLVLFFKINLAQESQTYIENEKLYGELENGLPEKDTLVKLKINNGTIKGEGKMAVSDNGISNFKCGFWKEYNLNGVLVAEGIYKISSYIDCGIDGAVRIYLNYRTGKWKYYKENGELDFVVDFVPEKHHIDTRCKGGDQVDFGIVKDIPLKYFDKLDADKLFEIQKINFSDAYLSTTIIPLNGKLFIVSKSKF